MLTETSKQAGNHSSQSNVSVAEGKKKEESYGPAVSSQDVFSDSENLAGRHQKTLPMFANEHGKMTQLQKKENQKHKTTRKGGRKKLRESQKRSIKLQVHVTQQEYEKLKEQYQISGILYLSDFLRILILNERKSRSIMNKRELIRQLDQTGAQISRIGNNINQIAKYANIQLISGKIDQRTLNRFNQFMENYLEEQRSLVRAYRALAKNKE